MKRSAKVAFNNDDSSEFDDPDAAEISREKGKESAPSNSSTCDAKLKQMDRNSIKKVVANVKKQKLTLHCLWKNCGFSNSGNVGKFVDHVATHISQLEVFQYESEESSLCYKCLWGECGALLNSTLEAQLHVYYHGAYQEAIEFGTAVMAHENFPQCNRTSSFKDCLSEDFDTSKKPKCLWSSCTQPEFINPYKFFEHVSGHVSNTDSKADCCAWDYCNKKSRSQNDLRRHVVCHTMEKCIACPTCSVSYCSVTKFFDHCVRQAEDKPYECDICCVKYPSLRILKTHQRCHRNTLECPYCDVTTSGPSHLSEHVRRKHLSAKPFSCQYCDYSTKTKKSLQDHIYIHFSDATRKCTADGCGYKCRSYYSMQKHRAEEHGIGIRLGFNCDMCSMKFRRGKSLRLHYVRVHKITLSEKIEYFRKDDGSHLVLPKDVIDLAEKEQSSGSPAESDSSMGSESSLFVTYDQLDTDGNVTSKVLVGTQSMTYMPQVLTLPNNPVEDTSQEQLTDINPIPITIDYPPMFIFQSSIDSLRNANKDAKAFHIIMQKPTEQG
ncbi:Hypothetical predicted protein [Cloeon dipterum]|uniref:C2H2-type domain-containing protein n=1 Tax=Cloeon dipterum TaxID=197152 RepID=A0A8S1BT06_9INSE|nr:Hypothetical predicted protein [Cloeon dipterum]